MDNCHKIDKLNITSNGLFDKIVNAVFIITLSKNGKQKNIKKQLDNYPEYFGNNTFIITSEGYKCKKKNIKKIINLEIDEDNIISQDIAFTYYIIFKYSIINKYDNILILQDDFEMQKELKNKIHIQRISDFIKNDRNWDIYSFGTLIRESSITSYNHHVKLLEGIGSHALIFSKNIIKKYVEDYDDTTQDNINWDFDNNFNKYNTYNYYIPLICQKFSQTENRKLNTKKTGIITNFLIKSMRLDKNIHPGYKIVYHWQHIKNILWKLFIFVYFVYIIQYIHKKEYKKGFLLILKRFIPLGFVFSFFD